MKQQLDLFTGKLVASGGLGSSYNQLFGFGYRGYGGTLTLNLPIVNRSGQSRLGNALIPGLAIFTASAEPLNKSRMK